MPIRLFWAVALGLVVISPGLAQDYSEDDKASTQAEIAAVKEELALCARPTLNFKKLLQK